MEENPPRENALLSPFRFIPRMLQLTLKAPLLYAPAWVCLVLAAIHCTAYVRLLCLRSHLVNDDTDVMSLSSLSSPVCPPPPSSKLSRGQGYQMAARETKERCSVKYQVATGMCDASPSPMAVAARCVRVTQPVRQPLLPPAG